MQFFHLINDIFLSLDFSEFCDSRTKGGALALQGLVISFSTLSVVADYQLLELCGGGHKISGGRWQHKGLMVTRGSLYHRVFKVFDWVRAKRTDNECVFAQLE